MVYVLRFKCVNDVGCDGMHLHHGSLVAFGGFGSNRNFGIQGFLKDSIDPDIAGYGVIHQCAPLLYTLMLKNHVCITPSV